jgi:hypothetical protein
MCFAMTFWNQKTVGSALISYDNIDMLLLQQVFILEHDDIAQSETLRFSFFGDF